MLYALLTICGIISFLSIMSRYFPLKLAASFFWLALLIFWFAEGGTYVTRGDPTDTILTVAFIFPPIIFMLWGLAGRSGSVDVETSYNSTGRVINRIMKSTTNRSTEPRQTGESAVEYRQKVKRALSKKATKR